jgi:hypothetical protein
MYVTVVRDIHRCIYWYMLAEGTNDNSMRIFSTVSIQKDRKIGAVLQEFLIDRYLFSNQFVNTILYNSQIVATRKWNRAKRTSK